MFHSVPSATVSQTTIADDVNDTTLTTNDAIDIQIKQPIGDYPLNRMLGRGISRRKKKICIVDLVSSRGPSHSNVVDVFPMRQLTAYACDR